MASGSFCSLQAQPLPGCTGLWRRCAVLRVHSRPSSPLPHMLPASLPVLAPAPSLTSTCGLASSYEATLTLKLARTTRHWKDFSCHMKDQPHRGGGTSRTEAQCWCLGPQIPALQPTPLCWWVPAILCLRATAFVFPTLLICFLCCTTPHKPC